MVSSLLALLTQQEQLWPVLWVLLRDVFQPVRGDAVFPSIRLVAGRCFRLGGDGHEPAWAGLRRSDISEHALGQRRR